MTGQTPVLLDWPLRGLLRARNSPARRVPSHGTHLMGTTYAIDLVPVDERGRSAPAGWGVLVGTEPPERFVGFGEPVHAPCSGRVILVHDGEADHVARRSPLAGVRYLAGQPARLRQGSAAIAGNHIVIALAETGPYVLLAHLRRGSVRVHAGDLVPSGRVVAACGNSGNSTQPHVHIQVCDTIRWDEARGIPLAFRTAAGPVLPGEGELVRAE